MTTNEGPDIERYLDAVADALPVLTAEEQHAAVALYRELAKGQPVGAAQLAAALKISAAKAGELLQRSSLRSLTYPDDHGRVLGFGGLAAAPMHHKFQVNGRTLWTWCAWDSLFIPELLDATAHVESPDPESGEVVRLEVGPHGVTAVEPESAVVSFLLPDASEFDKSAANIMATFCNFVFFFASRESGERWVAKHRGTFLYSLTEAVVLARRLNAKTFGLELAQRSSRASSGAAS